MLRITLPDGAHKDYDTPVTGMEIARSISPGLAKKALAIEVDGQEQDLDQPIDQDARVSLILRDQADPKALTILRHDCAHVLAEAVQALYPGTQVSIGPPIEAGFYYDFYRQDGVFTPDDLLRIEAKMREIIARGDAFERQEVSRDAARTLFADKGERFKVELIDDLPEGEAITLYRQGDWVDLCRGPHAPSTAYVGKAFKLTHVSGAYWRGDSNREQMQRIYGTAWESKAQLDAHLTRLEEAEKRDHRKIGRAMDLFHIQEQAVGSIFWHPKGWALYRTVESYMRRRLEKSGYQEVKSPQLIDRKLWEASGHWDKFREEMFTTHDDGDARILALKPMNCPGHVQIFRQGLKSYRELPLRLAEFGACHRNEPSGALHGIMRVRAFTQDDAHIFCTPEQINSEVEAFCTLLLDVYADFGFDKVAVKFSDRPEVRAGSDSTWDNAEAALRDAIDAVGLSYSVNPGEGAFYGPKLEFVLQDAIGREWQCGTMQVDFVLPEQLEASYIDSQSQRQRPVMLHRAILGSFERFLGILIEHYAGLFPLWLAPTQAIVATVVSDANPYAEEVVARLTAAGLRVEGDTRNEKISYKIREHVEARVPLILVVGRQEAEQGSVTLRRLGEKAQQLLSLDAVEALMRTEAQPPDLRP